MSRTSFESLSEVSKRSSSVSSRGSPPVNCGGGSAEPVTGSTFQMLVLEIEYSVGLKRHSIGEPSPSISRVARSKPAGGAPAISAPSSDAVARGRRMLLDGALTDPRSKAFVGDLQRLDREAAVHGRRRADVLDRDGAGERPGLDDLKVAVEQLDRHPAAAGALLVGLEPLEHRAGAGDATLEDDVLVAQAAAELVDEHVLSALGVGQRLVLGLEARAFCEEADDGVLDLEHEVASDDVWRFGHGYTSPTPTGDLPADRPSVRADAASRASARRSSCRRSFRSRPARPACARSTGRPAATSSATRAPTPSKSTATESGRAQAPSRAASAPPALTLRRPKRAHEGSVELRVAESRATAAGAVRARGRDGPAAAAAAAAGSLAGRRAVASGARQRRRAPLRGVACWERRRAAVQRPVLPAPPRGASGGCGSRGVRAAAPAGEAREQRREPAQVQAPVHAQAQAQAPEQGHARARRPAAAREASAACSRPGRSEPARRRARDRSLRAATVVPGSPREPRRAA